MGHVMLDLTQVAIAPGGSSIEVLCILGEVQILVPNSLRVECIGSHVAGQFQLNVMRCAPPSPTAPLVRVSGSAVGGTVTVRVVDPSAPRWWETFLEQRRKRPKPAKRVKQPKQRRGRLTD